MIQITSARRLTFSFLMVGMLGCSQQSLIGTGDGGADGGRDGGPFVQLDQCGNGLDDDGDGRIDDGCPCGLGEMQRCYEGDLANRGAGLCSDGIQVCATSTEWGDWGDNECTGSVVPASEECDGVDNDCDGAVDEGCPCTAGDSVECGVEFLSEPCRGGSQTCSPEGTWSDCEGAVLPEPELCGGDGSGNGVDEDCNAVVDDGCGCVPEPEQCRDGIDNDCDGTVDEAECMPDWPPPDCDPSLVAPRPIAPLSTSRVTSTQPALRWELPPGATDAVVELCADPDCTSIIETLRGATTASPSAPLPQGPAFWRLRTMGAMDPSCATSPTWEVFVGTGDTGLDTVQGFNTDINRDGHPDFLMGARWRDSSGLTPPVIEAVYGRAGAFPDGTTNQVVPGIRAWSIGDIDGDGFGDVVGSSAYGTCHVYRGTSSGIEGSIAVTFLNCRSVSGLGDFDGDGYGDLVVLSAGGGATGSRPPRLVFGSATLAAPVDVPHSIAIPNGWGYAHRAGDLNGDGLGDVIVSRKRKERSPSHISILTPTVFYGNASRAWGGGTSLGDMEPVAAAVPDQYAAGDVNGDGYGDLIIALPIDQNRVFHGGPAGVASLPSTTFIGSSFGVTARLGDIDRDGFEDFMVHGDVYRGGAAGLQTGTVVWALPAPTHSLLVGVGDMDGDGHADSILEVSLPCDVLTLSGTASGFGPGMSIPFMTTSPGVRTDSQILSGMAND